jgi:hypothetical protein
MMAFLFKKKTKNNSKDGEDIEVSEVGSILSAQRSAKVKYFGSARLYAAFLVRIFHV